MVASGSRIGPGFDLNIGLGGTSVAGDYWEAIAKVSTVVRVSAFLTQQSMAAGLHTPNGILGWDYILNRYVDCPFQGIPDGGVFDLVVNWWRPPSTLVGTSSTSFVWDPSSFVSGLLSQGSVAIGPTLALILQRVTNTLPSLP